MIIAPRFAPALSACCLAAAGLLAVSAAEVAYAQPASGRTLPKPRVFAPGVLTTIPADVAPEETVDVHDLVELRSNPELEWQPELSPESRTLFSRSQQVRFRRDIYCLEFSFKPLRMIWVDLPTADGGMEKTLVWYLVYQVRNTGGVLGPTDPTVRQTRFESAPAAKQVDDPRRFVPHFVLEGHELNADGQRLYRAYLDRVVPAAIEPIRRRETPGRVLHNSVSIAEEPLAPVGERDAEGVWGVAMWRGVDPEIDFFSVYVRGLSNAYQWADTPGEYQPGDPPGKGRTFVRKTLQLCFWRPGDRFLEHESEVHFGAPKGRESLYGVDEGVAHRWVYR